MQYESIHCTVMCVHIYIYYSAGKGGWTLIDKLADFQLLIFISGFLDLDTDVSNICTSITQRDIPLNEGYQLLVKSIAGIEM